MWINIEHDTYNRHKFTSLKINMIMQIQFNSLGILPLAKLDNFLLNISTTLALATTKHYPTQSIYIHTTITKRDQATIT